MSTLKYNGNEYNILYIDANIGANEGDGSTPSTALSNIPTTLTDKTCYIVRRQEDNEVTYVDLPQSWYNSLYYIMFIGMPTSKDPLYSVMEESAKTAWGNDTGKYARIRCNMSTSRGTSSYSIDINNTNNKCVFKTNSIRDFYASGCYFYRDGNGATARADGFANDYIFAFDYSSSFANVTFNNCKFGYTQYNLENNDYINNNIDISTDTSKYPQNKCKSYIYGTSINTFAMERCIINHVWVCESYTGNTSSYLGSQNVIRVNARKYSLSHCQYNILYRNSIDSATSASTQSIYLTSGDRGKAILNDIEINLIYTPTSSRCGLCALYSNCQDTIVNNIDIKCKIMGGGSLTSRNSVYDTSAVVYLYGRNSMYVNNIVADFSNSPFRNIRMLHISSSRDCIGNPNSKISNLYFKFNPNGSYSSYEPIVSIDGQYGTYGGSNVEGDYSTWSETYTYQTNCSKAWIIDNLIVDAPLCPNYTVELYRCGCKSPYINGRVYLSSATLNIKKHYNYNSTVTAVDIVGNSYYKCDDLEANLNYPGYDGTAQISYHRSSGTSVYVNKSNCILIDERTDSGTSIAESNSSFVCPNYIKTGQFFQKNAQCIAKSWNTVRTGSNAQGSIRFNNNFCVQADGPTVLIVGQTPYSGIQIVPSSIGKKILTAYIATKNFDTSETGYITGRIGLFVNCPEKYQDYYDGEKTLTRIHLFTSEGEGWKSDNSTWSGDTNLRTYKCEIPIEVFTLDEPIDVKIWFNWYSVNGYVYVDPDFKLTDII